MAAIRAEKANRTRFINKIINLAYLEIDNKDSKIESRRKVLQVVYFVCHISENGAYGDSDSKYDEQAEVFVTSENCKAILKKLKQDDYPEILFNKWYKQSCRYIRDMGVWLPYFIYFRTYKNMGSFFYKINFLSSFF